MPVTFDKNSAKDILAYALGATLYIPAIKENFASSIMRLAKKGLISAVLCLEDAIADDQVEQAEKNLVLQLSELHDCIQQGIVKQEDIPLLFVRIRNVEQMQFVAKMAEEYLYLLTGFVFPKFDQNNGEAFFASLSTINIDSGCYLYGMPVLEAESIIFRETRQKSLEIVGQIVDRYGDMVLNIRIGATDFLGLFGIRRSYDVTVYDIAVVRDCIAAIINSFCRMTRRYVVSGPVWEYFSGERSLKPMLRETPLRESFGDKSGRLQASLLGHYMDGLIKEIIIDKANGLIGKTVIHPTHITAVQSQYVVTHEEYVDACEILYAGQGNGASKSVYGNKMNEVKPHTYWAEKILQRAEVYGVLNENEHYFSLLDAKEIESEDQVH